MITYDRRALVEAYLDAHPRSRRGFYASNAYNSALREHQLKVLGGLRGLFGVDEQVQAGPARITGCNEQSLVAHLDVMDTLIAVSLGDRADATFTSADLANVGVDDTAGPKTADFDLWEDY